MSGEDWSSVEMAAAIAAYLDMLELELAGQRFNKSERRRELLLKLDRRSDASVEKRHQNISWAIRSLGYPHIVGYKPLPNFRHDRLFPELVYQLGNRPLLQQLAAQAIDRPAIAPVLKTFEGIEVAPPPKTHKVKEDSPSFVIEHGMKRDYLSQEARNQALGSAGERFVLEFEKWRLTRLGRSDLSAQVVHASQVHGDGLGFDIQSYDANGETRFIEVKTTAYSGETPFFISSSELMFSNRNANRYHLYRVFTFRESPKFYDLHGRVENHCHLDPVTYSAALG